MDLNDTPEQAEYRQHIRAWLEEHKGEAPILQGEGALTDPDEILAARRAWQGRLAEGGLAGATWPKEYGGQGVGPIEGVIISQEMRRAKVPGILDVIGVGMLGPTIIAHGTDEQKGRYHGPMLHGDEVWCQLFSEPGAGSDLAGLSTRAVRDGDEWVIDGQKVWTSGAHYSDYGILLARTDPDVPKHRGITYFLIDMHQPGVEVRPLRQITGASHFSEVFLTGARVPHDAVLGEVGGGWAAAMTTLGNERTFMGGNGAGPGLADLFALARSTGATKDPILRQHLASAHIRAEVMGYLGMQVRTAASKGQPPGPGASVLKVMAAWNSKCNAELALAMQGPAGMLADASAPEDGRWQQNFLFVPSLRIAGGSDEIQRNIVGERVLGLPPEPRTDKSVPFRDVPTAT